MTNPPVHCGEVLLVTPENKGVLGDYFVKIDGFIVFIKQVPENKTGVVMRVRVVVVKDTCGIAVYLDEA